MSPLPDPAPDDVVHADPEPGSGPIDDVDPRGRTAASPTEIPGTGWRDVARRVRSEWSDDRVGMIAAAVAFYAFLALIPALAALVSVLGLVARNDQPEQVVEDMFGALPAEARSLLTDQLDALSAQSAGSLSFGVVIGIVLSLWSASGAVGHLMDAMNVAYDEHEDRSWIRRKALALGLTLGAIVFVALAVFAVVVVPELLDRSGLGSAARSLVSVLIWPGLAVGFTFALAVIYRWGPDRRPARWRWVSVVAVVAWIAATLGFRAYVKFFGSYNETYGSLAGVVVALMWLWLTALIVMMGAEINAEIEHQTARDTTVGTPKSMGRRDAVMADTVGQAHPSAG